MALQNRFGTDVADPEHPFKGLFPVSQDIKEASSGLAGLTHPNSTTATEAAYQQMPAIGKGLMENNMDVFKGPMQPKGQVVMNPNNLMEHEASEHLRTPGDISLRNYGMTSLAEAKDKQTGYIASEENKRIAMATNTIGRNLFDAVLRKNPEDIKNEAQKYLELNPSGADLTKDLMTRIDKYAFTPTERGIIKAHTIQQIQAVLRLRQMRGQQ